MAKQKLKHATPEQLDEIYGHFYDCREWFPHIRKDYLARMIGAGTVVYHNGIIIVYARYQRKQALGNCSAAKGSVILHQILNPTRVTDTKRGRASSVLKMFFEHVGSSVWLTVRSNNKRAIAFYKKSGFSKAGNISWMGGELPGTVFKYDPFGPVQEPVCKHCKKKKGFHLAKTLHCPTGTKTGIGYTTYSKDQVFQANSPAKPKVLL